MKRTNKKTLKLTRPTATYSKDYLRYRETIRGWQKVHKDHLREYQREYQRMLRADPVKLAIGSSRTRIRAYLSGHTKTSHKAIDLLGVTRKQFATSKGMTEKGLISRLENAELDHIVPTSFFEKVENAHLRPWMHRHYNLRVVALEDNRAKHGWFNTEDTEVKLVLALMELDHANSINTFTARSIALVEELNAKVKLLKEMLAQNKDAN